jgi:hypothetical protein
MAMKRTPFSIMAKRLWPDAAVVHCKFSESAPERDAGTGQIRDYFALPY